MLFSRVSVWSVQHEHINCCISLTVITSICNMYQIKVVFQKINYDLMQLLPLLCSVYHWSGVSTSRQIRSVRLSALLCAHIQNRPIFLFLFGPHLNCNRKSQHLSPLVESVHDDHFISSQRLHPRALGVRKSGWLPPVDFFLELVQYSRQQYSHQHTCPDTQDVSYNK